MTDIQEEEVAPTTESTKEIPTLVIPVQEVTEKKEIPETQITELKEEKTKMQEFIEFIRDLIIIIFFVLIIRGYLVAPFQIQGTSMENSYHDKEFILVNKFSYAGDFGHYIGNPTRGDVVIFRPHASNGKEYYIKRVVGMPGDKIKFNDGEVYIKTEGKKDYIKLNEDYLSPLNKGKTFLPLNIKEQEFDIPSGEYFLMGDNRNNSSDSRSCFMTCSQGNSTHFAKRSDIVGMVWMDFGYINVFNPASSTGLGKFKWVSVPRFLNTPKTWKYLELE